MPSVEKILTFESAQKLAETYGNRPENLALAEEKLSVQIVSREGWMKIEGPKKKVDTAFEFFKILGSARSQGIRINSFDFRNMLARVADGKLGEITAVFENPVVVNLKRKSIVPKNVSQKKYLDLFKSSEIVFGIGPAGTGKTYLATAWALKMLQDKKVERIVLTRPAVEAGEALGFLPGDLQEKLLPYLRPLYDAIYDMLGAEESQKLTERRIIEIAPLAYMRGRTLQNAFVILDEAQNTTPEQMMMFLTRLGEGSRMAVTGDITQTDLPRHKKSGLREAVRFAKEKIRRDIGKPTFLTVNFTGAGSMYQVINNPEATQYWIDSWREEEQGKYAFVMVERLRNMARPKINLTERSKLPDTVGDYLNVADKLAALPPEEMVQALRDILRERPEFDRLGAYGKAISDDRLLEAFEKAKWLGMQKLLEDGRG